MRERILVIDDHREVVYAVSRLLESHGLEVVSAASPEQARGLIERADALIIDIRLEQESGLELLRQIRTDGYEIPAIILSAHTFPDNVIEASKHGAMQVLTKPIDSEALLRATSEAIAKVPQTENGLPKKHTNSDILGSSAAMMEVFKLLGVAASNELNLLLTGETGVGKEISAELVHRHSSRAQGPFVAINCTAMPENLLEAELFGHTAGAFTGANKASAGKIEAASGGTLFLDEIGDMPSSFQAKLLRFLEDKSFYRLGDSTPRQADVRIMAATNHDLISNTAAAFRSDLYYRLAQIMIDIPPLRERSEDLPSLIDFFLKSANREMGLELQGVSCTALQQASNHTWPGNVRELKNTVYRAAALKQRGIIDTFEFIESSTDAHGSTAGTYQTLDRMIDAALHNGELEQLLQGLEQRAMHRALTFHSGNKSRVAEALGVSRNTLRTKLQAAQQQTAKHRERSPAVQQGEAD